MHMADALVSPAVGGAMYVAAGAAAAYSVYKLGKDPEIEKKIPTMGVMGAFVFAAQMINFSIPGTGSSGHLCGGMMLTGLLGPYAGFISMIGVLLIQCLLFADGGLLALGCNIWNMAFFGCFAGGLLIWRPMMRSGVSAKKITLASILGCVITLQLGAACVVGETAISGISELPIGVFFGFMQPIHLAIGLVEGLITSAVLVFVAKDHPSLIWTGEEDRLAGEEPRNYKKFAGIMTALALVTGGLISLLASGDPDGLEWSIGKVTGSPELESSGQVYDLFGRVQESTSVLPDYSLPGSESMGGTFLSGVAGSLIVIVLLVVIGNIIRAARRGAETK